MRKPDLTDVHAFAATYDWPTLDPHGTMNWRDVAFGFLVGRGVDPKLIHPRLSEALACDDKADALKYLSWNGDD